MFRERQTGSYQCVGGFENMLLMSNPAQLTVAYLDRLVYIQEYVNK